MNTVPEQEFLHQIAILNLEGEVRSIASHVVHEAGVLAYITKLDFEEACSVVLQMQEVALFDKLLSSSVVKEFLHVHILGECKRFFIRESALIIREEATNS